MTSSVGGGAGTAGTRNAGCTVRWAWGTAAATVGVVQIERAQERATAAVIVGGTSVGSRARAYAGAGVACFCCFHFIAGCHRRPISRITIGACAIAIVFFVATTAAIGCAGVKCYGVVASADGCGLFCAGVAAVTTVAH